MPLISVPLATGNYDGLTATTGLIVFPDAICYPGHNPCIRSIAFRTENTTAVSWTLEAGLPTTAAGLRQDWFADNGRSFVCNYGKCGRVVPVGTSGTPMNVYFTTTGIGSFASLLEVDWDWCLPSC